MREYLPEFINYWFEVGGHKFVRVFWYFLFFEFLRYVGLEYFIATMFGLGKKRRNEKKARALERLRLENPLVSIIVPGKNEGKHLYGLVKSLDEQTYKNFEIIIVDDGSDDDTAIIGRSLEKAGLINRFLRNEVRGGKASAANFAWENSRGKFIVHLDADCSFDRDAIEQIILPFYLDDRIGAVGGNVKVRNHQESLATRLQALEYLKTVSVGRIVTSYLGIYRLISGAFGAFRPEILRSIGGWDVGPGLDGDISLKVKKAGYRIHFAHEAVCLTNVPKTFKKLTKQRLRWDKSLIRFRLRKHVDLILPNRSFRWNHFFSVAENLFYNLILDFVWIIYIIDVLFNYSSSLAFIIPMNYVLYTSTNFLQILASYFFSERGGQEKRLWIYILLMPLYVGYYLRIVRTIAYYQEGFFRKSYKDVWNPAKSSAQARELGI